jgi:O-antigen/teichoic acid export membrane protein
MPGRFSAWLLAHRNSTRLAFFLQTGCRVLTALCSLLWARLLLRAMGAALNGLFLNFQGIASLGGLGDLGMGGMVNIQTSRLLGQGKEKELRSFLAAARGFFGLVLLAAVVVFLAVSPGLLRSQKFATVPTTGPLPGLYVIGALAVGMVILNSYIMNLNYGCGNILWPVIPGFVLLQLGSMFHWLLARHGLPLWVQYIPYVAAAVLTHALNWWWIRLSHPALGTVRPITMQWRQFPSLAAKSFWVYLYSVAAGIISTTSGLLIAAGFSPDLVPTYRYNGRLCELTLFVSVSAGAVSLPKITQWLASPDPETQRRAIREAGRLNQFQTLLGCAGALAYLAANEWFIQFWLGKNFHAPLSWQAAFAANLAVTCAGQVGFDLAPRCCEGGMRVGGITTALMASLNLGLSLLAAKMGSLFGIALAGVVAQSIGLMGLGWYTCRQMHISWWRLSLRNWLLALAVTALGILMHSWMPVNSVLSATGTAFGSLAAVLLAAFLLGIRIKDLREEALVLRGIFGSK